MDVLCRIGMSSIRFGIWHRQGWLERTSGLGGLGRTKGAEDARLRLDGSIGPFTDVDRGCVGAYELKYNVSACIKTSDGQSRQEHRSREAERHGSGSGSGEPAREKHTLRTVKDTDSAVLDTVEDVLDGAFLPTEDIDVKWVSMELVYVGDMRGLVEEELEGKAGDVLGMLMQ